MPPPKGRGNNPRGNPRASRNASMTRRERAALDAENTGSLAKRVAVVAIRARQAGWS